MQDTILQLAPDEPAKAPSFSVQLELSQAEILAMFPPEDQAVILERLHVLGVVSQMVGDDFAMNVELNRPGAGWHWDFKANKVRADPVDLVSKSVDYNRGGMLHEGAHRLLSRLSSIPTAMWETIGFSILCNCIDDCRVNNFVCDSYPAGPQQLAALYEREKEIEESPEVQEPGIIPTPSSIRAGLELIKLWYKERAGEKVTIDPELPPEIQKFLKKTYKAASSLWWTYPSVEEVRATPDLARHYSQAIVEGIAEKVWPEFQKLVEADLQDATLAEMLRSFNRGPEIDIPVQLASELSEEELQALIDAITAGNLEIGGSGGGMAGAGGVIILDKLPPELRRKLEEFIKSLSPEAQRRLAERSRGFLDKVMRGIEDKLKGGGESSGQGAGKGGAAGDSKSEKPDDYQTASGGEAQPRPARSSYGASSDGAGGASGNALEDFFDQFPLSPEDWEEIRLESERMGVKHDSTPVPQRRGPGNRRTKSLLDEEFDKEVPEEARGQGGPLYDRTRREMSSIMNALESELRQIFVNRLKRRWTSGHRTGPLLDIPVRIREIAGGVSPAKSRIFKQREDPDRVDYAFTLLVDVSGSMGGDKMRETFKAVVAIVEVLNRLGVKVEVLGFDGKTYEFKKFGESLSSKSRGKIGSLPAAGGGGTRDAQAIYTAATRLMAQRAKEKYLLVLTDGMSGMGEQLERIVAEIRAQGEVKLIGFGIGPGTEFVDRYYPNSCSNVEVPVIPRLLSRTIKKAIKDYSMFKR